jgi:DNA-binding protein H-NS
MSTYQELKSKAGELLKQAEKVRKKEMRAVIAEIRSLMAAYDIGIDDLQPATADKRAVGPKGRSVAAKAGKAKPATRRAIVKPKYRNPETGATWTGRGKPPNWIKDAKSRDAFLINQE